MNKELETLEKLLSFAFVMSENMVGLTKGNYDENQFIKKTYEYLHKYNVDLNSKLELKKSLQRLESIDNSNPSKALEELKRIDWNITYLLSDCDINEEVSMSLDSIRENKSCEVIKQALLKLQESKKYLTWKDLNFKEEEQTMKVLLNGTEYMLSYFTDGIYKYIDLLTDNMRYPMGRYVDCYSYEKQFFNDLRLERVKNEKED